MSTCPTVADVALVAADDESSIRLVLAYGAFDYLIKPFTVMRLEELLARHDQSSVDHLIRAAPGAPEGLPRSVDPHTLER